MEEATKQIEAEIKRVSAIAGKCQSRWAIGYIDGLRQALKLINRNCGKGGSDEK